MIEMRSATLCLCLFLGLATIFCYCARRESSDNNSNTAPPKDLVAVNKYLVKKNQQNIINFVHRKGWDMKETSTGLWFMIYEHGSGAKAKKGNSISLSYSVSLLDGNLCYNSDSLGLKTFRIGSGHVESGLEEAALLLRQGDKARLILPPHLAYGLPGDNNLIPPRSTILYELTVVQIK
jgi:FKBP-type peptidyl-prolyl cis-trans isomerase FkpA